jgi:hypothetical protein
LLQAEQNAEVYLERLFNTLGYKEVVFEDWWRNDLSLLGDQT